MPVVVPPPFISCVEQETSISSAHLIGKNRHALTGVSRKSATTFFIGKKGSLFGSGMSLRRTTHDACSRYIALCSSGTITQYVPSRCLYIFFLLSTIHECLRKVKHTFDIKKVVPVLGSYRKLPIVQWMASALSQVLPLFPQ